jgi:isoaspartyl peptidase/L-asparaginase-like protein (Ntn-hydrolase superfamily)
VTSGPIIIGSERSEAGLALGMDLLRHGGSALDAVEVSLRACEDNLDDHYIGTGGLPNARGEVELDASIMVGSSRAFGAVGAVRNFPNPISIARAVLEKLPQHSLLVGEGAELFADEQGFARAELLTDDAMDIFRAALAASGEAVEGENSDAAPGDDRYRIVATQLVRRFLPFDGPWGTVNVIALDESGEMVVGVSTSGYPWKYPGRVGDSSLPGSGNYCDLRYGGAACTGRGELSMRIAGAKMVVDALARGEEPVEACGAMLKEAAQLPDIYRSQLRTLCLTPDGRHAGAASQGGATYSVMTVTSTEPEIVPRVQFPS